MKISSKEKIEKLTNILNFIFGIQKYLLKTIEVNKPKNEPCIYALLHGHQCSLYGLSNKERTSVLISNSIDGQIIANAVQNLGMKCVRGSKGKKGAVEGTIQMISLLKEKQNVAITVDGPSGPRGVVKNGVIKIAKISGCPIIPYIWYSPDISFISLPSWDKFTYPFGYTRVINLYGDPIYVSNEGSEEDEELARLKVEKALEELQKKAPEEWKKAWKYRLWI